MGLRRGESVNFTVRGDCMQILVNGESVAVRRQRFYLPGDVVVVRRRDHWNAHRFLGYALGVHGVVALTQADEAVSRDPAALVTAVVGRAECGVTVRDRVTALGKYARALLHRLIEGGRWAP